ncbi:MAG: FAD/NAD(P)-binding protein [Desulfomonilaceae bacterium]|nr:FAD/NAD(P)-binding protein [Desulfomonilaceae bacterium]
MPDRLVRAPYPMTKVFYRPALAQVLRVDQLTQSENLLALRMGTGEPLNHEPGQFVQVSLFGYGEAPISICSSPKGKEGFEICVREVGTVSGAIHDLEPGDWIGIRGPYGRGFPVVELEGKDVLIVAGGIGMAPLRSLVGHIRDNRRRYGRIIVVYGAKNPAAILFKNDLKVWFEDEGIELYVTVDSPDESWTGRSGVVTSIIRDLDLGSSASMNAVVVGPPVMYRFVAMELFRHGLTEDRIIFSLERRFKCGIGKCGHCQVNDLYVCRDGPVFRYSELLGRSEAVEVWAPEEQ